MQQLAYNIIDMDYASVSAFFFQWADAYRERGVTNKQVMMIHMARKFTEMANISAPHTTIITKDNH